MFFTRDGTVQLFVNIPVTCIYAAIANHFIMLLWNVTDKTLYKFHNRYGFLHIFIIFMAVVMESNKITIIVVNPRGGNDRTY